MAGRKRQEEEKSQRTGLKTGHYDGIWMPTVPDKSNSSAALCRRAQQAAATTRRTGRP